jgi:type I restriction enzyme S subunit
MEIRTRFKKIDSDIIPEEWDVLTIGKVSKVVGGGTPSTTNPKYWNGGINWFTPTEIGKSKYSDNSERKISKEGLENSSAKLLPVGSVLLTTRATIGDASILLRESATNQGFQSLIPNPNINGEFLYYSILSRKKQLIQNSSGSTFLEISPTKLKAITLLFPPSEEEQSAIATALADIDRLITRLETLILKKRDIKHSIMQRLLQPKRGWKKKRLGSVAILKARIGWQGLTTEEYLDSGDYHLVTGTDFKDGYIDWDYCHFVGYDRYMQDKYIQVKKGDVLVTKDGTIGKVAFIKELKKPATLNSGIFVIRPLDREFHSEYIYHVLVSEYFKNFLSQLAAGSTISHLYQKDFVHFTFSTPPVYEEQVSIANTLSDFDNELRGLDLKLKKYKHMKLGMMQQLLTGKIRLI